MRTLFLLAFLVGCPSTQPGFTSGPGDDDDATDAEGPEVLETAGSVGVFYWQKPDAQGDLQAGAQFSASFWNVLQYGEPGEGGVDIAVPDAVDTCALTTWTLGDEATTGGVDGIQQDLLAGALTLSSPDWSVELPPNANDGPTTYYFELNPDHTIHHLAPYGVAAPGGQFPAFDVPDALELPAALVLDQPTTDTYFALDGGAWELLWSGGSEERLWVELANESPGDAAQVQINCDVLNDGAFTIPADLMAQVPEGPELRLTLDQPVSGTFEVEGLVVGTGVTASAQALGAR